MKNFFCDISCALSLSEMDKIGNRRFKKLIDDFGGCKKALCSLLKKEENFSFLEGEKKRWSNFLSKHTSKKIDLITYEEKNYPFRLKELIDPPALLYYKGEKIWNHPRTLSIVGTRKATPYGIEWTRQFIEALRPYEVLIVSGLAEGIDIAAHQAALKNNLPTIAVMAGGLDTIYPAKHKDTALEIIKKGGMLLSEHPLETPFYRHHFPLRNRIIAALSDATIVVEAGEKSGALITAYHANAINREVFSLTGSVNRSTSKGCHHLIKTHQAHLISEPEDLIKTMQWEKIPPKKREKKQHSAEESTIIKLLKESETPLHIDQLYYKSQIAYPKLLAALDEMKEKSLILKKPNHHYVLF